MLHQTRVVDHRFINAPTSIKAQRDARTGGGIGFAASQRIKDCLAGIFWRPYSSKTTGGVKFKRGPISFVVWITLSKATHCGRFSRPCRSPVIPLLHIPRIGIVTVCCRDKTILQGIEAELLLKFQAHLHTLTNKSSLEGAAGRLPRLAGVQNLCKGALFVGCTDTQRTLRRTFDLKNLGKRFALLS